MQYRTRVALIAAVACAAGLYAQNPLPAPIESRSVALEVDSGPVPAPPAQPAIVYSETVRIPDATWLRLRFGEVALAGDPLRGDGAYLVITSLADGAYQILDALSVRQWRNTTAYFNGDAVRVDLVAWPGTGTSRVAIVEAAAGLPGAPETICFGTDDRVLSNDPRAGRILPVGCTGWLINDCNHCFLTAGHCDFAMDVVEFNVPLSNPDGSLNHPPPEDQYAVDPASVQSNGGQGIGNDWAYFGCFPNSNTGLTPFEAQQAAFDLADAAPPVQGQQIRITGYGTVSSPVPLTWNQVQKTHVGPYVTSSGTTVQYQTDTTGGNSGSPVIDESTGLAIGIHTHGGCGSSGGANSGTAIQHPGLQAALANPQGVCNASALTFSFPNGVPDVISSLGGSTVRVEVLGSGSLQPQPGSGMLHYDDGSGLVSVPMTQVSDNVYDAVFPAFDCGATVTFFFSALGDNGVTYFDPGGCSPPQAGYSALAAANVIDVFSDDFETDLGWTVGAPGDTATTGIWNRMDPEGTAAQPEDDHTAAPGTMCYVTDGRAGTSLGQYDVDGGATTLLSPVFDLSSAPDARISYWRWYSNNTGASPNADVFVVDITNDGVNWVNVETVGPAGPGTGGGWIFHEFSVADFVTPTATVRLRFVASDLGSGSIVEAAIDDLRVRVVECTTCVGDLDGDGDVDLTDLSVLLANFGTTSGATPEMGDLDGDGDVDLTDLSGVLNAFGTACGG